jgi:hypothetical protein
MKLAEFSRTVSLLSLAVAGSWILGSAADAATGTSGRQASVERVVGVQSGSPAILNVPGWHMDPCIFNPEQCD